MVCSYKCPHLHQAASSYAKEDLCIPYSCTKRYQLKRTLCKGGPLHTITCIPLSLYLIFAYPIIKQLWSFMQRRTFAYYYLYIPLFAYHYFYVQYNYETVKLTISDNHQELMQKPWCADVLICTS